MSILVSVEPAFASPEALQAAAALARRWEARLILAFLPPGRRVPRPEVEAAVRDLAPTLGPDVQIRALQGDAETALLDCARESAARLVVFTADPQSSRIDHLAGAVVRSLPTPLLLIRDPVPLEEWARGGHTLRLLAALDFSPASEAALSWAGHVCRTGPCHVTAGHVGWLPGQRRRLGLTTPLDPVAEEEEIRRVLQRDLTEFVGRVPGEPQVEFAVRLGLGRTADAVAFLADELRSELVVVGTHQRSGLSRLWHGSVAGGVLRECRTNVVCVPLESAEPPAERPIPELATVLVATDLSELGNRAVPYAFSLLPKGGTVHLVHVAEPGEGNEADVLARLRQMEPTLARQRGVQTLCEVVRGRNPAEAICGLAERRDADVVCVGSHGRTGLTRVLLGSVAEKVVGASSRPVLVVRPPRDDE